MCRRKQVLPKPETYRQICSALDTKQKELAKFIISKLDSAQLNNLLEIAIQEADDDILKMLLGAGADPNFGITCVKRTKKGDISETYDGTLMHQLALDMHDDETTVRLARILLRFGAELDILTDSEITPLYLAYKHKKHELISFLIVNGASQECKSMSWKYELTDAVENPYASDVLPYVIRANFNTEIENNPLLHMAVKNITNKEVAMVLLRVGFDIDSADEDGLTCLHHYTKHGNLPMVKFLVKNNADVNLLSDDQLNALWYAVSESEIAIVNWLVKQGVRVNESYPDDESILHEACRHDDHTMIWLLLERGAPFVAPNDRGCVPFSLLPNDGMESEFEMRKAAKLLLKMHALADDKYFELVVLKDQPLKLRCFKQYKRELEFSKKLAVRVNTSVYDVLKLSKSLLIHRVRNSKFVRALIGIINQELIPHYSDILLNRLAEAVKKKDQLLAEQELLSVFGFNNRQQISEITKSENEPSTEVYRFKGFYK